MSTVVCIGVGTVGRAWAVVFARAGSDVRHYDAIDGEAARTDYDWTPEQIAAAHAEPAARLPIDSIADRQAWRDRQILALRQLKQKQSF